MSRKTRQQPAPALRHGSSPEVSHSKAGTTAAIIASIGHHLKLPLMSFHWRSSQLPIVFAPFGELSLEMKAAALWARVSHPSVRLIRPDLGRLTDYEFTVGSLVLSRASWPARAVPSLLALERLPW